MSEDQLYLGKADLLSDGDLPEEDFPLRRGTVRIRGLNRDEALRLSEANLTTKERERQMLVAAMVTPTMDYKDVSRWQLKAQAGDIEKLTTRIAYLSGMLPEQQKEETVRFPGAPDDAVRVLPGEGVGDDSRPVDEDVEP